MLYPDLPRVPISEAKIFFTNDVKPHMPDAIAMGNDVGGDDGCGEIDIGLLTDNVQIAILRSL